MNKRDLKKSINNLCSELFAECVAISLYDEKVDKSNVEALLQSIVSMNCDFVNRVSHPEPGLAQKDYFKKLTTSFEEQVTEIIDQMNNMH